MKILVIADRPPREKIKVTLENNKDIELICTLGDLDYFSLRELTDIDNIPKIGVYGNHCSGTYFEELGIQNMHLQTFQFKGLTFGGFEGSVRYKKDSYAKMYTQEEANALLQDFPYVDVMLTHCPPYGINDDPGELAHEGFHALRKYLDEKSPRYLLHGHTYPSEETMVKKYKNTNIIYVYEDRIISFNE